MSDADRENIFYSAVIHAWVDSQMERDRTILSLSAGGIGLLVSLLVAFGPSRSWALWTLAPAALVFIAATGIGLEIFKRNGPYLKQLALPKSQASAESIKQMERSLDRLDRLFVTCFFLGVVLSVAAGLGMAGLDSMEGER